MSRFQMGGDRNFFFSGRRRHTMWPRDWSSDVCSSDLNNMPVFFIQDGIKFPDRVHAIKPEQDNEIPQATGAHDTFWDFVSLTPETTHMIMWLLSDRAIPRSYRMMQGFGVHSFRFIDKNGKSRVEIGRAHD